MEMTGAHIIVKSLIEQGVDTLFAYPGGTVLNIFDALGDYKDKIRLILPAHEQGGAHAADGYARVSGKTGVVLATSGPGATNLVTGIANAYMDSIPMVAITGNVALGLIGRDSFQEVDICGITMPITKHNFMVKDPTELASTIKEAFTIANSGRPGPVLIDIPKDVTAHSCEYNSAGRFTINEAPVPNDDDIKQLIEMFEKSEKPLVFCGGGILRANAQKELLIFCEETKTPIAASLMGLSAVACEHPLMLGMIGMHGTPYANHAAEECDLLICCGTRFSDRVAGDRKRFAPNAKLVHIDIDPSEFDKNIVCDLHITGNLKDVFKKLLSLHCHHADYKSDPKKWLGELIHYRAKNPMPVAMDIKRANPRSIPRAIGLLAGEDAIIVTDVGQHQMWTAQYYNFCKPNSFVTSGGLGAMGFGMGAAVGAKAAACSAKGTADKPVVLITGDGSFHMNMAELATSVTEKLPVIIVVMNNGVLGMVRQWQRMFYDCRYTSTTTNRPTDYVKIAEAFGGLGFKAFSMDEFVEAFKEALASGQTCVIDCAIDPDEKVFPMIPPGKSGKDILYTEAAD